MDNPKYHRKYTLLANMQRNDEKTTVSAVMTKTLDIQLTIRKQEESYS